MPSRQCALTDLLDSAASWFLDSATHERGGSFVVRLTTGLKGEGMEVQTRFLSDDVVFEGVAGSTHLFRERPCSSLALNPVA